MICTGKRKFEFPPFWLLQHEDRARSRVTSNQSKLLDNREKQCPALATICDWESSQCFGRTRTKS